MGKFDLDDGMKDLDMLGSLGGAPDETPPTPDQGESGRGDATPDAAARPAGDADPAPDDAQLAVYKPEGDQPLAEISGLAESLLAKSVVTAEQVASAMRVVRQTPGKRMETVLVEAGVDEAEVQSSVAGLSQLPFERIDPDDPDSFDLKALNKLGMEFCKVNNLMPLRRMGSRMVVGTTSPDHDGVAADRHGPAEEIIRLRV